MGNGSSRLKGVVIEKTAVEANDFFVLKNASNSIYPSANKEDKLVEVEGRLEKLSIFQAERTQNSLWPGRQGPMKHAIRNYMIYRHPCILKYIATWEQSGETYLATERVRPLSSVLNELSDIQVCLGLRNLLCGLIFLTEKALACHLNICQSSIYITENGLWRLAGFEYVWKASDLKNELIELLNQYRYKPAVDPDELKNDANRNTIEQYAFAVLCEEILDRKAKSKPNSDCNTPHIVEFREYCSTVLRHKNPELRPKLAAVLLHPYFNHEFILIHSFLFELPLKSLNEKQEFLTRLVDRLRHFSESVVASQLTGDLLSRMVLLDPTAQLCVTPYVLKWRRGNAESSLFGRDTYLRHVWPIIKRMFRLRDAQMRLILLEYFMEYVSLLTEQELKEFILPHLLIGMNDTNDLLVAKTLRCMADLIPILGAVDVLAGVVSDRCKLFSDGRPQTTAADNVGHRLEPRSITPVLSSVQENRADDDEVGYMVSASPELRDNIELSGSFNSLAQSELAVGTPTTNALLIEMPPRLSPDGGEDDKSAIITDGIASTVEHETPSISVVKSRHSSNSESVELAQSKHNYITDAEDDAAWSDWETEHAEQPNAENSIETAKHADNTINQITNAPIAVKHNSKQIIDDLNAFDIQIQKIVPAKSEKREEFDFFKDMEPVIKPDASTSLDVHSSAQNIEEEKILIDNSRFAALSLADNLLHNDGDHGWDVEEDDYND